MMKMIYSWQAKNYPTPDGEQLDALLAFIGRETLPELGGELSYDSRPDRLLANVRAGEVALGVFQNPIAADDLFRVIQAGARLPRKSTFFSPKIPSGLVVRDFGAGDLP